MAQYYTLEEAARLLQTSADEVKKLAEDRKVRAFRDRGTLRFRAQDVEELARTLGLGSDPELQLGEVPAPKKGSSPVPKKPKPAQEEDVFEFNVGLEDSDQVEIGQPPPAAAGGSKSGAKSGKTGMRSPAPKPGSDSDVRLVNEGSDVDFQVKPEPPKSQGPKTPGSGKKGSGKQAGPDSGVRIVPLDERPDSDVKMVMDPAEEAVSLGPSRPRKASDSDIRLEDSKPPRPGSGELVTEEIDLDEELSKSGELPAAGPPPKAAKPAQPKLPTSSPFELSEADLDAAKPKAAKPAKPTQHAKSPEDSSDEYELAPGEPSSSPLEVGSDEVPALSLEDEEVKLGELTAGAGDSGINLKDPADSGISLEQEGSDEMEFELSLDAGATPRPAPAAGLEDSDSEFELSLDESSETEAPKKTSDFELSVDDSSGELEAAAGAESSEFELSLDEAGSSPLNESGDRDIFETDFEVPALEEESGSEAVALDDGSDLENSDFDLALGDEDMAAEDESGSQVVALDDEEEADEGAETVARPTGARAKARKAAARAPKLTEQAEEEEAEPSAWSDLGAGAEEDEETLPGKVKIEYRDTPAAPWGPLPALLMIPSVVVLFVVGLMGFELIQSMTGYQKGNKATGLIIEPLTEAVMGPLPGKQGGAKK